MPNSDIENDSIYKIHKYFELKHSAYSYMNNFISENGPAGKVYIDFVNTTDFHEMALSGEAQAMCKQGTNAGGNSEISEALSFETFHRVGHAKHVKVSRVWSCVFCICWKIVLLLKFLFFTPSQGLPETQLNYFKCTRNPIHIEPLPNDITLR